MPDPIAFDNSYARLPERFFARVKPTPVASPRLIKLNEPLARQLGLDPRWLAKMDGVEMLAGNYLPRGSDPIAMAYAGHQFGSFVPQLGDGRAILLGEVIDQGGAHRDIHLKGSGQTPYSRRGDGRAALGPVLREYIVSESFAALGIPTTRALAAIMTGEVVLRETPLPGAVLARVAASHVRVGTFQFFASRGDVEGVKHLADYVIARLYPEAADAPDRYRTLLDMVIGRQATLIAQWMSVGFIHGVMNTDNMSIAGETIDFGPCAFMDNYDPATVYSSIDRMGRYAFANQPAITQWNLAWLAECLLPLLSDNADRARALAIESIEAFPARFEAAHLSCLRRKLGLFTQQPDDLSLANDLFDRMARSKADFTLTFRRLCDAAAGSEGDAAVRALFAEPGDFDEWAIKWRARLSQEKASASERRSAMRSVNPLFIARNHLVEEVIAAAVDRLDFALFEQLLTVLAKPFEDQPQLARYADPPRPDQVVHATFCGT